jgi:hypothetical protein
MVAAGVELAGTGGDRQAREGQRSSALHEKVTVGGRTVLYFCDRHPLGDANLHHQGASFRACPKIGPYFFLLETFLASWFPK